ncbi:RES family NAD+ phosphorylase [Vreelandella rituensis]|uniref:RES domain-containing protein n=1 Tax=Vreelandella rituensis TaxID=2282306 RepID=A0A368TMD9_9GAMM|nr:RES family NAD+ phosphorylase [Halomonas rituensis]RCV85680.1 RES domain-containing protein [Halomonas rituensis]
MLGDLSRLETTACQGFRLVNSKFPPISLFDDVASAEEFEMLYELQAMTNPRLRDELGDLGLIPIGEIPFDIPGCSYATAPFTHINPTGSRFSTGEYGVLYIADVLETALAEVCHHQEVYWKNVPNLSYERFVFRGLRCRFHETGMADGQEIPREHPVYAPDDYTASQALGKAVKNEGAPGLRYHSVRKPGAVCWALMTPRLVTSIVQAAHYEMVWNGTITGVNCISTP